MNIYYKRLINILFLEHLIKMKKMSLEILPDEILEIILDYSYREVGYSFKDVYCLSLVSKRWNRIIKNMSFRVLLYSFDNNKYTNNIFKKIKITSIELYINEELTEETLYYLNDNLKQIKNTTLSFDYTLYCLEIKKIVNIITNIDKLFFCLNDVFDLDMYDNDFFCPNSRLKMLDLFETRITNRELSDLFEKFPNISQLHIEECEMLDNELFELADKYLKNLFFLSITVEEDDSLCFNEKDIKYINKNYPNIKILYVNGEIY